MEKQLIFDLLEEEKSHWWHVAKRALVRQYIRPRHGEALVLGAGGGMICNDLKERGYGVTAIDISPVSCDHIAHEFGVNVVRVDLEQALTISDASFDVIIATDILEHLEKDIQLLSEVFRCLKSGGQMIITVPAYPNFWSSWDERLGHKRRYTSADIMTLVKGAGFRIEKLTYFNTFICAFVYCYRKSRLYRTKALSGTSDFSILPDRLPSLLFKVYYFLERTAIVLFNMPFGLSILAVAVKNG